MQYTDEIIHVGIFTPGFFFIVILISQLKPTTNDLHVDVDLTTFWPDGNKAQSCENIQHFHL